MKKVYIFFFIFSCALMTQAQNLNDSLLIYYSFNGDANDYSGNNFNGVIYNAVPTTDHAGNQNSAYHFNGVDSYITLPLDPALKPQLPLSFSFWVKFDNVTPAYSQIFRTDYNLDSYTGILFGLNPTTYQLQETYGDGTPGVTSLSTRRTKISQSVMQAGVWYFIVGVIRGVQDMDIYIDCENNGGTYVGSGGVMAYSSNPGSIGRTDAAGVPPYYFLGSLDEFRYWHRALTSEDVRQLCEFSGVDESIPVKNDNSCILYPNPATGLLSVSAVITEIEAEYNIYNINGQKVITGKFSQGDDYTIDISGLDKGEYLLKINDNERILEANFIKQ